MERKEGEQHSTDNTLGGSSMFPDSVRDYMYKPRIINGRMAAVDGPIKTFPLRGIKDSPPYLHDRRLLTLEDTVGLGTTAGTTTGGITIVTSSGGLTSTGTGSLGTGAATGADTVLAHIGHIPAWLDA